MSDSYTNIVDFLRCRSVCFFCNESLGCRITHFLSSFNELPVISAPIENDIVIFPFQYTTATFNLQVEGRIDINTNILTFSAKDSDTPIIDTALAKGVFLSMMPHVQLYCNCKHHYTAVSDVFKVNRLDSGYSIKPLDFFYESFVMGNLWVQNDYVRRKTNIYTRSNDGASPITYPILDWNAMGKNKLLTRVKTLVVFS